MVPGDKLVTLPFGSTPAELERAVARSGYSRFVITDVTEPTWATCT